MIQNYSYDKFTGWMKHLTDDVSISALTIPATHDSATSSLSGVSSLSGEIAASTSQTQEWDIETQLKQGIRFLDLRCKIKNNRLGLYHGIFFLEGYLEDALVHIIYFLNTNPSETVLVSIKNEDGSNSNQLNSQFYTILENIINKYKQNLFLYDHVPLLGEVRNKIVLLRRFALPNHHPFMGINVFDNWLDNNKAFAINYKPSIPNKQDITIFIQDFYSTGNDDEKWKAIEAKLTQAESDPKKENMYINFASAVGGFPPDPKSMADKINNKLTDFLNNNIFGPDGISFQKKRYGCIIMDYPYLPLIRLLIDSN